MENSKENHHSEKAEKENKSRRKFLVMAGNTAIGIAAVGSVGVTLDFLSPNLIQEIPSRFKIGTLASMQPGSVTFDADHRLFVMRDKQSFLYALSAVCTHLGCTVRWNVAGIKGHPEGVIACPCHGSIFSKSGEVLRGPATRPLDRFKMYLEDDKIIVNTAEKVSAEEMILRV